MRLKVVMSSPDITPREAEFHFPPASEWMGMAKRVAAYVLSATAASLFYLAWTCAEIASSTPAGAQFDVRGDLLVSLFFWLADGFCATLVVMTLPWILAVWAHRRFRWSGPVYYGGIGALLILIVGCVMSSFGFFQTSQDRHFELQRYETLTTKLNGIRFGKPRR